MSCPMTKQTVEKNGLTNRQVKNFCDHGCSVDCHLLFDEYIKNLKKRRARNA